MLTALELDHGIWHRRRVDAAALDALAAQRDDVALVMLSVRIPDAALRAAARRRTIRLRIAASPFPEVRDDAAHVEEVMMQLGKNPISPRLQRPVVAHVDPDKLALRGVVVVRRGATCVDDHGNLTLLSAGRDGMRGMDGADGNTGVRGDDGRPGRRALRGAPRWRCRRWRRPVPRRTPRLRDERELVAVPPLHRTLPVPIDGRHTQHRLRLTRRSGGGTV